MTDARPTSLIAVLFTDIVGSVALKRRIGNQTYVRILTRHNAIFTAIAAALPDGRVVQTTGDGLLARFATASTAAQAALLFQAALRQEPWEPEAPGVRVGIHVGEVIEVEGVNGARDISGLAVDLAARVMSLALPGQALLTKAAYDAAWPYVREHPPGTDPRPSLRWVSHGQYVFKGAEDEPFEVFEVGADGLAPLAAPPDSEKAWRPTRQTPHNLPRRLTSFVGRTAELADLRELLRGSRLLTLIGSGGCGKTRLALRLAETVLDDFPDGVWFAELAALAPQAEQNVVAQKVRTVLGLKEAVGQTSEKAALDHLGRSTVLLVFDNCEHLVEPAAALAETLLEACPNLKVVATSQKVLGVDGETVYRAPSLSAPAADAPRRAADLAGSDAVTLFVERARAAQPGFELTDATAPAVAHVCRRLDGIPLALELAGARVRAMGLEQIAGRLDDMFPVLAAGPRSALPRHQTLRATIQWSFDLLTAPEKLLLQRLSIFAGGWALDAAERVCGDEALPPADVLAALMALTDSSLVTFKKTPDGLGRYGLLDSVRQFAASELARGGELPALRRRHRDVYLALAEHALTQLLGQNQSAWLARLELEHDNVRAALAWSAARGRDGDAAAVEPALRLAGAMWCFWDLHGHFAVGQAALAEALALPESDRPSAARATVLNAAGFLVYRLGDTAAARPLAERSLAIRRELGDVPGVGRSLTNLGNIVCDAGDRPHARACYEEALAIHQRTGNRVWEAGNLGNLADIALQQDLFEEARDRATRGRDLSRRVGNAAWEALSLDYLSLAERELGDLAAARAAQVASLTLKQAIGDRFGVAVSAGICGGFAAARGEFARGAQFLAASERLRTDLAAPLRPGEAARFQRDWAFVRGRLSADDLARARADGEAMTAAQALAAVLDWLNGP